MVSRNRCVADVVVVVMIVVVVVVVLGSTVATPIKQPSLA